LQKSAKKPPLFTAAEAGVSLYKKEIKLEDSLSNVNWLVTGIVGISTSVIGAFLYAIFGKLSAKYSEKRRSSRLDKLKVEIEQLDKLSSSDTNVLIYCFRNLFYILALSALASALSFYSVIDYIAGSLLGVSIWVSIFLIGMGVFITLGKLSKHETHTKELTDEISQLEQLQGDK